MYRQNPIQQTTINWNNSTEGETIEQKIERIVENKEPIEDGAPIIHTARIDGVMPEYNIRTDRFDLAIDGTDQINQSIIAKRDEKAEAQRQEREEALRPKTTDKSGKPESTQGQAE